MIDHGQRYRVTLAANTFTVGGGNANAAMTRFDFHVLPGDANRDGVVNIQDLLIVAQNYNAIVMVALRPHSNRRRFMMMLLAENGRFDWRKRW